MRLVPRAHAAARTACLVLVLLSCTGPPAAAQTAEGEMAEMQNEIRQLRQRLQQLEARLQEMREQRQAETGGSAAQAAAGAGKTDSVILARPAEPDVAVGGRVRLDVIHNSRSVGGSGGSNRADQVFSPAQVPLSDAGETSQTSFNARDSRLWVTARTPTPAGDLSGYLEVDFASSDGAGNERVSNSYNLRLRHAYARYRAFTLGQTYTGFLNLSAYPETNDINGPVGILNIRQPMLRYRHGTEWGGLMLSLEQPETTLSTAAGRIAPDDDRVPDVVGRVDFEGDWGNWSVATLLRQLRIDDAALAGGAESQWGAAVSTAGRVYFGPRHNLRFSLSYGNGLGRYLSYNGFNDASLDAGGNLSLTEVIGGFLSYQHWWSDTLRSSLTAGYAYADNDIVVDPAGTNRSFYSTHLNLIWSPTLNTSVGIEWLHGYRELEDGRDGELDRIQFTSTYKF